MNTNELTDAEKQAALDALLGQSLDPDAVGGGFTEVALGEYVAKLEAPPEVKEVGANSRPTLVVRWVLKQALTKRADCEKSVGGDLAQFFRLEVLPPKVKGGGPFAPGYKEAYTVLATLNGGLAPSERPKVVSDGKGGAQFDGQAFRRIFAKYAGKKLVHLVYMESIYKDKLTQEKKTTKRIKILGLYGNQSSNDFQAATEEFQAATGESAEESFFDSGSYA
jgi:hypothetical protein